MSVYKVKWMSKLTSVSSDLSSSAFAEEPTLDDRLQNDEAVNVSEELTCCRPAFSRSRSFHERTEARRESISKHCHLLVVLRGKEREENITSVNIKIRGVTLWLTEGFHKVFVHES